ncbi:penicillin acylase family protein [Microvirga aerilata]|uniref:Penicillin acylase family protein n=1 Tax=Microvirga aerilata TaxID=670292 RepID=A0A937CZ89_9HYPH|nr:penicillin acylase family protein [Microvirga aerilata]MBL0406379.1 penicillin acylase family protein [Microvirga aerilata]
MSRILAAVGTLALAILFASLWAYTQLRSSLPLLEGTVMAPGLSAPVAVARDAHGVPTLTGRSRADLAWVLGYLHAQERFFQMDGQRRLAAGELSELAGTAALTQDRERRLHRFRSRARAVLAAMIPEERLVLDAYAGGVNRGLRDLEAPPFEYMFLRSTPAPWLAEDTVLTVYTMYFDLQEDDGRTERRRAEAGEALGSSLAAFLFPEGTSWDAPLDSSNLPTPPMPDRHSSMGAHPPIRAGDGSVESASLGSNNWAVGGALSTSGSAIVANDMHLGLRVPNIWYRARLILDDKDTGDHLNITGVTLPGAPNIVAGSNGKIAWGFTNSYVDTSDVVILEPAEEGSSLYRTPEGPQPLDRVEEKICSKGAACEMLSVEESLWGPVIGVDRQGRKLAYRWIAHDPIAVNLRGMLALERTGSARDALGIAHRLGIPHQNLVVGDVRGNIGWTVTTGLPQRFGFDGRLPVSWADGSKGWNGYLAPQEVPVVYNPENRRVWTANSRVVGGEAFGRLGFGAYAHGSRARQIRDQLLARERFDERDMLAIQLDDRGVLLERWQGLLLQHLWACAGHPQYAPLIPEVENWGGRAVPESVGYRLVRTFRAEVIGAIYDAYTVPMRAGEPAQANDQRLRPITSKQADEPVWRLITERPAHLLPAGYQSWDAVVNAGIARTLSAVASQAGGQLGAFTWGAANRAEIRHPLTRVVPGLSLLLNPSSEPQPGDLYQPRVASPTTGASERFVVAPGHEGTGIFHMPTSQTGHPLSPYYMAGHEDWVRGQAAPFLPGEPRWRMVFQP